jgi:hypothetical protein
LKKEKTYEINNKKKKKKKKKKVGIKFCEIVREKNRRGRKCRKITLSILPLHVAFFLAHLTKNLLYIFFFNLSNVEGILSIK